MVQKDCIGNLIEKHTVCGLFSSVLIIKLEFGRVEICPFVIQRSTSKTFRMLYLNGCSGVSEICTLLI